MRPRPFLLGYEAQRANWSPPLVPRIRPPNVHRCGPHASSRRLRGLRPRGARSLDRGGGIPLADAGPPVGKRGRFHRHGPRPDRCRIHQHPFGGQPDPEPDSGSGLRGRMGGRGRGRAHRSLSGRAGGTERALPEPGRLALPRGDRGGRDRSGGGPRDVHRPRGRGRRRRSRSLRRGAGRAQPSLHQRRDRPVHRRVGGPGARSGPGDDDGRDGRHRRGR